MKIEEAIKQSKFKSEAHKAGINIFYTAAYLQGIHHKVFKEFGISGQQYNVLRIVNGQAPNPASVQLINERMIDPSSNVSRLVDKLVDKKLVSRKACKQDRRQVDIRLTDAAKSLIDEVQQKLEEQNKGLSDIDERLLIDLNNCLDLIREKVKI